MLSSSSYRRCAIIAAISTLIQSILWVICFILYIFTYTCEINPLPSWDSNNLIHSLSLYVQAHKCNPLLDILDLTICNAVSSQSTSILLGLLCTGISINLSLLTASILLIKKVWKIDKTASGVQCSIQVLIFYISSLFIASGWDLVVTGYAIYDYSTVAAVQKLKCENLSKGIMVFFLTTSRGFIVWLFNIIYGFILLKFVLSTKSLKKNVNAIENEGHNAHSSQIHNELTWTTPDPMAFGRQPPPHSAMSKWPHLAALNQQEQPQLHLRQNVINRREDDEIQSRWNIFAPGTNDLQDKQHTMDNWSRPQATNLNRTQSITSEGKQWSKMQNRYDNVLESYESSPIAGPRLNRNPSVASKQTSMNVQRDWNQGVHTNEQVGSVSPPAPVQPKRPLDHLPSDAFKYDSGDFFWNVKLRPVRPPPGVKAEEVKRPTEPAPPPPTRENPPPPPPTSAPPLASAPLDFAPSSPSYEEDTPRPMSLQEAILTIRPLKTVKRPSFNHLRQN